ncbi:MAG TPA: ATP-grasp domain-containing protein [Kofleriaceae bacterium]
MSAHVLVIGGLRPVHKRLKARGARLSLVIETHRIKPDDPPFYGRILGVAKDAPLAEYMAAARAVHSLDPITAVGAYHELFQDMAAHIASALELPFHALDTITTVRHKDVMRQRLRAAGVDPTIACRVQTADHVRAFAATHGYPVVLKPVDGWASIGVSVLRGDADIAPAVDWLQRGSPESAMLVEQHLAGDEISVEAMSERGVHRIVCATQKFKETVHYVELGHIIPAPLPPEVEAAVRATVDRALTAVGIRDGASHTEVMLTATGPRIVETHTRLGGDQIPELIEFVSGVDLMDLWARQTLGERVLGEVPDRLPESKYAAIWFVTPEAVGTVERVDGEAEARAMPGVTSVQTWKPAGSKVDGLRDSFSRGVGIIAIGESPGEAMSRAQDAGKRIRFVVCCGG